MNTVTNNQISIGDIRIGNRFKIELSGTSYDCFVKQIFVNEVEVVISKIMIPTTVSIHKLKPVRITPELLLSCDFEELYNSKIRTKFQLKENSDVVYEFINEHFGSGGFLLKGTWFPCDYIHELQNLFYITQKKNLI